MPEPGDQIVYRSFAVAGSENWGEFRLVVDGVDVTKFDGAWTELGSYDLTDPYGYGPANFRFPQLSILDRFSLPSWLAKKNDVDLWHVKDGEPVRRVWAGLIHEWNLTSTAIEISCGGDLSGRAAMRYKPAEIVYSTKDAGQLVHLALRHNRVPHPDAVGTGIEISERSLTTGTHLSYMDSLVSLMQRRDGTQWTIMPNVSGQYETILRDRTTVNATFFMDAHGVSPEISESAFDEWTTAYAQGRRNDGGLWSNIKAPNWVQGPTPDFPGDIVRGDSGINVYVLEARLRSVGYLDKDDTDYLYDDETADAVEELQKDAGLPLDGTTVDAATWDALWNLGVTGFNLRNVHIAPILQKETVAAYKRGATGAVIGDNPDYTGEQEVDIFIDYGNMPKRRAIKMTEAKYEQVNGSPNFTGTITFETDLAASTYVSGTPDPFSKLDIEPGHNLLARNFGDTLLHVSGVSVSFPSPGQPLQVRCAVDSKGRDFLEVTQIIARNKESRRNPARQWRREMRGTHGNEQIPEWNVEMGGKLGMDVPLEGDQWNVIPIFAGQSGTLQAVDLSVRDSKCPFYVAISTQKTTPAWWNSVVGNPATDNAWESGSVAEQHKGRIILEAWGQPDQRCGYYPRKQTNDAGNATGAPVTGDFYETAGLPYFTSVHRDDATENCVLWLAIYPTQDCVLKAGQVLRVNFEAGM